MSRPKVLVMASQKGGVGKTSLSAHLSVAAVAADIGPVVLIDQDPQGSLWGWWNRRKATAPLMAKAGGDLQQTLQKCDETGARLVIIDTPPSNTDSLRTILGHADFVLIPTQDGITDINAIKNTVAMVREVGKPYAIVLTFINKRTTQYADATRVLSRAGAIAAIVSYRAIYKRADNDGRTAQEVEPGGAAAAEIAELWQFVGEEMGLIQSAREEKAVV